MSGAAFWSRDNALRFSLSSLALLFVALAVAGGVRGYSSVPFWDMWESYVPFMDKAASGDWSVWWQQHNEHRILLARLFFWLDLRMFQGAGWFLIVVNYGLVAVAAALFCRILREVKAAPERALEMHALAAFIVSWVFFWSQWENLTWGFQSQFILAQLLPLAAFYALYRSLQDGGLAFALACLLGVLSAGTMANGVLALPLMTVYALLTRQGARRVGMLATLTAVVLFAYFHGYTPVAGHGSLSQALREHPVKFVRYVLMYLGNPFNAAFGGSGFGRTSAQLLGLFFVLSSLRFARQALRQPRASALPLAILFFIAYIAGTAVGTAGGRLIFGVGQALSSRYSTPALMAWAALLILYAPSLLALEGRRRKIAWGAIAVLALLMLGYQRGALTSRADELFDRSVGALATEMRVRDQVEIGHVYINTATITLTEQAAERRRSIFGLYPYRGARAAMGTVFAPVPLPACQGFLDAFTPVEGDQGFLRVGGWLWDPAGKIVPKAVRFLDAEGKQVGYAVAGRSRHDVAKLVAKEALRSGFRGYISTAQLGPQVTMRAEGPSGPFCQLQVNAPLPFVVTAEPPSAARATVGTASVAEGSTWAGTDFYKSRFAGMQVYGSYLGADADVGSIVLRLKRGDRLFYRTGPSVKQQTMEIEGGAKIAMPMATDWVLLDFSSDALPREPFSVKFSDQGSGWGEWSAIALQSN